MKLYQINSLLVFPISFCLAATPAPEIDQSPGDSYIATIDPTENIHNTSGALFIASSPTSPAGIAITLSNLPSSGGPFSYHIHTHPVPIDPATGLRNCTAALAHLDPYDRGESPPCDPSAPQSCQLGDLAGKHGAVPAGQRSYAAHYADPFISTDARNVDAFVGGGARSVVVHFANKTRVACANLVVLPGAAAVPVPVRNATGGDGGRCAGQAPYPVGNNMSLPVAMVTASGTAPAVPRQSGLLLAGVPTTTRGPASKASIGAAVRMAGGRKVWVAGVLGGGVALWAL